MEYQKKNKKNLIDNAPNQPSKFRIKNWVEINDESRVTYNAGVQTKFKTAMWKSSLCDYGDAYTLVKWNITVDNTAAAGADVNNTNKKVIYKNYAPFTDCIREINTTDIDNSKYIDKVMVMHNLIEHCDNYSKTSVKIYQL